MNPKVTVIIPTYNRQAVLGRAIDSVLGQTFKDWELIIVDDGSTDDSRKIFESLERDNRVSIIEQSNQGVSTARNQGIELAKGEWLAFLDSDDEWLVDKLEKQVTLGNQRPDLAIIHGDEIWIRNGVRVNAMNKHQKSGGALFQRSLELCCISPSTVMIKRELFNEVGLFREDFPVCEDYDLWLRITANHEVGYIDQHLIKKYGGAEDQLSRKFKAMDYWRIKAIDYCLSEVNLSADNRQAAQDDVIKKCRLLLKGYRKHSNLATFDDVFQINLKHSLKASN